MKYIAFNDGTTAQMGGVLPDGSVTTLAPLNTFYTDPTDWAAKVKSQTKGAPYASLNRIPAVPASARVICIGLNYHQHAVETGQPIPDYPVVFGRWVASLGVDGDTVPAIEEKFDWEGELAVIIGTEMAYVSEQDAKQGIFGYAAFNDLSARAVQGFSHQWTLGKNSDKSGPLGAIIPADQAGDPADGWALKTLVNGEVVQNSSTADLIFSVPTLIAKLSQVMTLYPGDMIATGTPAGVGLGFKPPRFLSAGDVVEVSIDGLGSVKNTIVAPPQVSKF